MDNEFSDEFISNFILDFTNFMENTDFFEQYSNILLDVEVEALVDFLNVDMIIIGDKRKKLIDSIEIEIKKQYDNKAIIKRNKGIL